MGRHAVYLRIMLWSLGFAACLGVISVLFAAYDLMGRVIGTAVLVGVCSGLMIPISKLADRQETRPASMLGMGIVTVDFLVALFWIWVEPILGYRYRFEEELPATLASLTLPGFFAVVFLANWRHEAARLACRLGLVISVVVAFLLLWATWSRELFIWWLGGTAGSDWYMAHHHLQEYLAETALAVGAYGVLAVALLWRRKVEPWRWWRWAGTAAGAGACAMWFEYIWVGTSSPLGEVICSALSAVAAVTAYANMVGFVRLPAAQSWLPRACVACAAVTAVVVVLYVAYESDFLPQLPEEALVRLGSAGGILAGCGSLAMVVLARLHRRVYAEESVTPLSDVEMVCPRCRREQKVPLGDSVCPGCRLRISIRVEEPRCVTCGYLLIGAVSDRCPECGTPIGAAGAQRV